MLKKLEKLRSFLRGLQRSDRNRKKRWLVGLTTITMILVVTLWFVYVNAVGLPVLAPTSGSGQAEKPKEDERSAWDIFKTGLSEIFSDAKGQFETSKKLIEDQVKKVNEVTISATSTATSSLDKSDQ